jgi:phosphoribosylaminoimidazolecarboxamide formyltransferase / IMP cyclohydrolase
LQPRRAILSVSDKAGLAAFSRGLVRLGFELYATSGTKAALQEAAVEVRSVSDLTGFPEILEGRVRTLHPSVHGGLLARRDDPDHMETLDQHGIKTIDLVCVNLYPFAETAAREEATFDEVLEQIDIGGPALIRAGAKNHSHVLVVVRPERYRDVLAALGAQGQATAELRRHLAAEAFAHTAAYDAQIAAWLRPEEEFQTEISLAGTRAIPLSYGENPHQRAAFYRIGVDPGGLGSLKQLQGEDLSYNNVQDAAAAIQLVSEFGRPAAAIIKHTNPCGLALADSLVDAYAKCLECDRVSAFGGVAAFNRPLDQATAERVIGIKTDVVIAPEVEESARETLARRPRTRVLEVGPVRRPHIYLCTVPGGFLAQGWDNQGFDRSACTVVSQRKPDEEEWEQLEFAWLTCKHVKSNAIVIARDFAAVGVGAGQMSRVEAAQLAVQRAQERAKGGVMASDAFFPFPDGVEVGIEAGVTAFIQPGGSLRDGGVVKAADKAGVAMVMTGVRHFKH